MLFYNYQMVNINHRVIIKGGISMSDKQTAAMLEAGDCYAVDC